MPTSLLSRGRSEKGFTLIELLVVMLIIGILAAIALPAFLGQRQKARDTEAKTQLRTMVVAMETFYNDKQSYQGADFTTLKGIEPTLNDGKVTAQVVSVDADNQGYNIVATSSSGTQFKVTRTNANRTIRTCNAAGTGGCNASGSW